MAKKFRAKPFKDWLDHLCAVVVKTRDSFQCQIVHDPACAGTMIPKDRNCITGCGHCHNFAHKNPVEFGVWFAGKYPHRMSWLDCMNRQPKKTWRQSDFEDIERKLLQKAIDLNVDYLHINEKYREHY
ncbi:MAG: hypothetical protein ACXABD_22740 [Candidatus Thorarchaeota archaeon]|jgi:hypothetical protein